MTRFRKAESAEQRPVRFGWVGRNSCEVLDKAALSVDAY